MKFSIKKIQCLVAGILVLCAFAMAAPQNDAADTDSAAVSYGDTVQIAVDGRIHLPGEILMLLTRSDRRYDLNVSDSTWASDSSTTPVLTNDYYQILAGDSAIVAEYILSDSAQLDFAAAEGAFEAGDCEDAIPFYHAMLGVQPDYYAALVWLGQCFNVTGMEDSAAYYYRLSIEKNFIDYNAHWFLADLLWNRDDTTEAVREITLAHILNINHQSITEDLRAMRDAAGRPWKDWSFRPRCVLSDSGHVTVIRTNLRWMMYAMTKALWKSEPGYAEKMSGRPYADSMFSFLEEKEALSTWIVFNMDRKDLPDDTLAALAKDIIYDGYLEEFIYYERIAPENPAVMMSLTPDILERIADYVDKYH